MVLVGKGITFDSGGLSIKPAEGMSTMKRDMTGGAVVMAVMAALGALGCPLRVTGLVPAAENAVGASRMRPGDVVTHYGGRTSEVMNTDAEGRLVLADAMAYALDELDPAVLVDVATLTGTMKVALGQWTGGYFANDDALAESSGDAGAAAGEPLWRMPLEPDYEDTLKSHDRRRQQLTRAAPARSRRRCSCSTSPATCRGPTSTSPRRATPRRTPSSGPTVPPASAPGPCSPG